VTLKITKALFLLLVFSLPLVRPFNFDFGEFTLPFTDVIFLAVFFFWIVSLIRREIELPLDGFLAVAIFYAAALTLSAAFSEEPRRSFLKLGGEVYLIVLAIITADLAENTRFAKYIGIAWLNGTIVTVLASLAGFVLFYLDYRSPVDNYFLSPFGSLPAGNYPRIHALFLNANMMCNYLNISVMFAIAAARFNWLRKGLAATIQFGIWFAAFFTLSPGIGGLFLSVAIWMRATLRQKKRPIASRLALAAGIIAATLCLGAALVSPDTENVDAQVAVPMTNIKIEPSVRVLVWSDAARTFLRSPLMGKGTGTDVVRLRYVTLSGQNQLLLDAHDLWLSILAQSGLIGFAAFLTLTVFVLKQCRFELSDDDSNANLRFAMSCAVVGTMFYQGITGSFEDARHLWVLIGLVVGLGRNRPVNESEVSASLPEETQRDI